MTAISEHTIIIKPKAQDHQNEKVLYLKREKLQKIYRLGGERFTRLPKNYNVSICIVVRNLIPLLNKKLLI